MVTANTMITISVESGVMTIGTKMGDLDMKKIVLIFAALAAMISCNEADHVLTPQSPEITITAGHTKTVIGNDASVSWDGNEEITVLFTKGKSDFHAEKFENLNEAGATAKFVGRITAGVNTSKGWDDAAYCIYPSESVNDNGKVVHSLPAMQYAHASVPGSFESGLNLSYAGVSLSKLEEKHQGDVIFKNALTTLRLTPGSDDITSITVNGSAPLTGAAPMVFDGDGKLVVDVEAQWAGSKTVVLKPAAGSGCFAKGVTYNILVYPGTHETFSVTLNYKEFGDYTRSLNKAPTLKASEYYVLGFNSDSNQLVLKLVDSIEALEDRLPSIDQLEKDVQKLESQVQSVTLMSEYLDNAAYAPYAAFNSSIKKDDITLDYIVKPESAAQALVDAFESDHSVVSAIAIYSESTVFSDLAVKSLSISNVSGVGKIVTATIDAGNVSDNFYKGNIGASVALQVTSGSSDLLSDFANLVPKAGSAFDGSFMKDVPVIPGARVVIPFNYAVSDPDPDASYTMAITGQENVSGAYVNYNKDFKSGNLSVPISSSAPIASQKVTLSLTVGKETVSHTFTFVDSGSRIEFVNPGTVDYIGGEIALEMNNQNIKSYMLSCSGAGVSQSGNIFSFSENTGAQRTVTVECQANIQSVSLNYYKSITLTQKAYNTSLTKTYYTNGQKVVLNQANASGCSNYFNIVILGDGYKKKDLAVGGKFERSARSAMDSFFAVEPYATFKNRFNVYMVAYESADEGTDIKASGITKNTYFDSYCQGGGNTAAYVENADKVVNAVKAAVGSGDAMYYRSIAILLVNTDENSGSTGYPYRDYKSGFVNGYASFAIAVLAANSTGTNGLVKHEAGGHAFGRLADEYYTNGNTAAQSNKTDLSNWHAKGWYWNVNPSNTGNYYKFTNSAYSSQEVSFIEGAWGYNYGIYRPTQGGMMQGSTGVFNAPSRHAIYHRIITESEGTGSYSWSKFLNYDQKNR